MTDEVESFPAGPPADSAGRTADDPTKNVRDLAEAAAKRADDLREMAEQCRKELAAKDAEIEVWKYRLDQERDRRYAEVSAATEKALDIKDKGDIEARRIKENADKEARQLAQKAQEDRDEAAKVSANFVLAQQTRNEGVTSARTQQAVSTNLVIALVSLAVFAAIGVAAIILG